MRCRAGFWTAWGLLIASTAFAIGDEYKQDSKWTERKPHGEPQVGGIYMNLGPTGIRAQLRSTAFEVKYIFPDSPAAGRVQPGDLIVGVNGRPFTTPHTFGFDWDKAKTGYEGPMMDFGSAIEESEGKEGVLTLAVQRGTSRSPSSSRSAPSGNSRPRSPTSAGSPIRSTRKSASTSRSPSTTGRGEASRWRSAAWFCWRAAIPST